MIWLHKTKTSQKSKIILYGYQYKIVHVKENIFIECWDITKDLQQRFDTSNYKLKRLLPKGENKKVISLMKDELDGKTIKEFVGLRTKTNSKVKKQKVQKMCNKKKTYLKILKNVY